LIITPTNCSVAVFGKYEALCGITRRGAAVKVNLNMEIKNVVDSPACVFEIQIKLAAICSLKKHARLKRLGGRKESQSEVASRFNDESGGDPFAIKKVSTKEDQPFTRSAGRGRQIMRSECRGH
jgi:hypothetical protein